MGRHASRRRVVPATSTLAALRSGDVRDAIEQRPERTGRRRSREPLT